MIDLNILGQRAQRASRRLAVLRAPEKNRALILHTIEVNPRIRMVTPYMYHHYIDALIRSDEKERAMDEMKRYWGEMIHDGADTFWELYNPFNKYESPYGSVAVNSFCHTFAHGTRAQAGTRGCR